MAAKPSALRSCDQSPKKFWLLVPLTVLGALGAGTAVTLLCWRRRQRIRLLERKAARDGDGLRSLQDELLEAIALEHVENYARMSGEEISAQFELATEWVGSHGGSLDTESKLALYGCYKQATIGDPPERKPWGIESAMKWEAWNEQRGKPSFLAKGRYLIALTKLVPNWRLGDEGVLPESRSKPDGSNGMGLAVSTMGRLGDAGAPDDVDDTPIGQLCEKIANGERETVVDILQKQPTLAFQRDKDGMSPLHWAADRGDVAIARNLLSLASTHEFLIACLGARDKLSGDTPLHYAVNAENIEVALLLVAEGASQLVANDDGETPESLAHGPHWAGIFQPST